MSSFKEVRELLLVAYDSEIINDEEFLVLFENYRSRNPQFPYNSYPRFELENMQDDECLTEFRVKKEDVPRLADVLQIPETVRCEQRSVCGRIEGLCMLLRRLAYPCRYSDMIHRFARPVPEICMITNTVMDFIFDHHAHRLTQWNLSIMNAQALQSYADAVSARGAPLQNCFGFVDGTVRPIARPGEHQRLVYNGHKRVHSLKFQSLALPNGLIANMYGPIEGKRHDACMLVESKLLRDLERNAFSPTGEPMCIYGDPAYPHRVNLQCPFRQRVLTPDMEAFNKAMSQVRVSVEWLFGDIVNYFKFLDFKKNLKIGMSSIGKLYLVSALLQNAITCLYGNNISEFFDLQPPSLQYYFQ
ncbi:uncharacterized protein [Porites lutea]|uniref:uncharacterized protein n=1 Tax=Porites lutea TaxID=51062 RepID=UPI003CC64916